MSNRNILIAICTLSFGYSLVVSLYIISNGSTNQLLGLSIPVLALLPVVFSIVYISKPLNQLLAKWLNVTAEKISDNQISQRNEFSTIESLLSYYSSISTETDKQLVDARSKLESVQHSCEAAIIQSKEASRLAEESRASNLLSASSKLENAVQRIMVAARELSSRMESVSRGADVQMQRMNVTSSSMGEMNLAISDISRSSSDASVSIVGAKEQASSSAQIASQTVDAIGNVNKTSEVLKVNMANLFQQAQGIDDIINVITEIADQTNLLALNAAIEAARAGDAGRGFAVVADEVRKLAEKTMTATKEVSESIVSIQNAINENVEQMNTAVTGANAAATMAERAGESAELILNHIEENSSKILSIATASEEQSASSEHINRAISEVEQVANEIAEGIHQSTDSVVELSMLANELTVLVEDLKSAMQPDVLMPWTSNLENGVKFVDEQHQVLVKIINSLYAAMKSGEGRSVVSDLLDELVKYTVYHFGNEEKCFDQLKYSETAQHKKIHKELTDQVIRHVEQFKTGSADISMDLMNFLKDWLSNHICKVDKRYTKTFLDGGIEPTKKNKKFIALSS